MSKTGKMANLWLVLQEVIAIKKNTPAPGTTARMGEGIPGPTSII